MTEPPSPFDTPRSSLDLPETGFTGGRSRRTKMEYMEAYKNFFETPKWGMNMLFLSLNFFIPIVGPIVIQGYQTTLLARRHVHGDLVPLEFKWDNFGEFLGRGIWPFLVSLITALIFVPVIGAAVVPMAIMMSSHDERMLVPTVIATALTVFIFFLAMFFSSQPLMLRGMFLQKIDGVFRFGFIRDFIARMWVEQLLVLLFIWATSVPLVLVGYLMCGLGIYPAMTLIWHAMYQLHLQLYEVYLSKGGIPVEIDPKLPAANLK